MDDSIDMETEEETIKYMRTENTAQPNASTYELDINKFFPLSEHGGLACIVKHYGNDDDILVNTRIEAVGFLSLNPALEALWQDSDAEDRTMHPPPSLVPRLHAIVVRKLSHCNPELPLRLEGVGRFILKAVFPSQKNISYRNGLHGNPRQFREGPHNNFFR